MLACDLGQVLTYSKSKCKLNNLLVLENRHTFLVFPKYFGLSSFAPCPRVCKWRRLLIATLCTLRRWLMAAAAVKVWTGTGQAVSVWSLNTPAGLLTQSQGVQQLRKLRSLGMGQWSWATVCHYVSALLDSSAA